MNWLKRLFGKLKSAEQEKTKTPTPVAESAPVTTEKAATEPAEATTETTSEEPAEAPPAPEPAKAEPVAEAEPAAETDSAPEPALANPAMSVLDDGERAAELKTETQQAETPKAKSPKAKPPKADAAETNGQQTEIPLTEAPQAIEEGPYGPASAKPASDGTAPSAEFTIKGKESSKLFHTEESPYFGRTKADVWFKSAADAESAGFTAYTRKKATAKK